MTAERIVIGLFVACLVAILSLMAGLGFMSAGLAMEVQEQGPAVPPELEADYRQVAHERGLDWALLAAWDGVESGFQLPVPSRHQIYGEMVDAELAKRRELAEERCREDPASCPPPEPSLDPEERELLAQAAERQWHRLIRQHISGHADRLLTQQGDLASVLPPEKAARALELYDAYLLLDQLAQDDDHVIEMVESGPPEGWQPVDGFAWPAVGPITSRYGMRVSPIDGQRRLHAGIDMGLDADVPVWSSKAGRVVRAEYDQTYGLVVVVDHGDGYRSLYAHNSRLEVGVGDQVRQGQLLARAGSTGWSTGPHLHFEIHWQGAPVDPLLLLGR